MILNDAFQKKICSFLYKIQYIIINYLFQPTEGHIQRCKQKKTALNSHTSLRAQKSAQLVRYT